MYDEAVIAVLLREAPRFDSIAHAVYWLRWGAGFDKHSYTRLDEDLVGYHRITDHIEIHLAEIYALAETLYREQHIDGA